MGGLGGRVSPPGVRRRKAPDLFMAAEMTPRIYATGRRHDGRARLRGCALRHEDDAMTERAAGATEATRPARAEQARVLVVDDQRNMRATTALLLRDAGYAVAEAEDG